jgi:hypothetical protein
MAFTDDFNRANLGANWTQWYPAWGDCSISNNQFITSTGQITGAYFTGLGAPTSQAQYMQADLSGFGYYGASYTIGVAVRVSGQNSTRSGYFLEVIDDGATSRTVRIVKWSNGSSSTLSTTTYATGASFTLRLEITAGNALTAYINGTQITALNVTDSSSPLTGAYTGIFGQAGSVLPADNAAGGDIAPPDDGSAFQEDAFQNDAFQTDPDANRSLFPRRRRHTMGVLSHF